MTDKPVTPEMVAIADQRITHANQFIDKLIKHQADLLIYSDRAVATMELAVAIDMFIESKSAIADALAAAVARFITHDWETK